MGEVVYKRALDEIREFMRLEVAGGVLLLTAAVVALIAANSAFAPIYARFLDLPVEFRVGAFAIAKPLLLWINDGLMAVFFLLVGLEIKRELLAGELATIRQAILPGIGAAGGMLVPALIYVGFNAGDPTALNGWAIPAATDIAFALGVLSLLGRRVPAGLKVFLLALAILDDLGAIIIIAVFYTSTLSVGALAAAAVILVLLLTLNRLGVTRIAPYALLGIVLWVCVLKSGVHATLAGVAIAFAVPLKGRGMVTQSPLTHLEHMLHPWVTFLIMPLFGFANAGVSLAGIDAKGLGNPIILGIALGLFLGKQIGVFGFVAAAIALGLARRPDGVTWPMLYGTAILAGIGFTMSLFIGTLAWESTAFAAPLRLGVLAGSLASGLFGYAVLRFAFRRAESPLKA